MSPFIASAQFYSTSQLNAIFAVLGGMLFLAILVIMALAKLNAARRGAVAACALFSAMFAMSGCQSAPSTGPAPTEEQRQAKIQQVSAGIEMLSKTGVAYYLTKNAGSGPYFTAAAEVIEASANADVLDPAAVQSAVAKAIGNPDDAAAISLALAGGFGLYQTFVGANVDAAFDTRPAYKAALLAFARGIRAGAVGDQNVTAAGKRPALVYLEDFILQ